MYLDKDRLAEVAGDTLTDTDRKDVVADGHEGAQGRDGEHDRRGTHNGAHAVPPDALVDDALNQPRDREVEEHQCREKDEGEHGRPPVRPHESEQLADMSRCIRSVYRQEATQAPVRPRTRPSVPASREGCGRSAPALRQPAARASSGGSRQRWRRASPGPAASPRARCIAGRWRSGAG